MLSTSFSNKTQYLRIFLFYWVGSDLMHLGLGWIRPGHEQWRHSPLFTLQDSRDEEMQQKKKKEKEKGRAGYPARQRCLADGRNDGGRWWTKRAAWPMDGDPSYFSSVSTLLPSLFLFYFLEESLRFWEGLSSLFTEAKWWQVGWPASKR